MKCLAVHLDELPPQTRKLLSSIYDWVQQQCEAEKINQRDFRFSRREVRKANDCGNTQIRIRMDRLMDMEYVIVHRGGRGQTFTYELVYGGNGEHGEAFISGLIRQTSLATATSRGWRITWRGQNGAKTVGLRSAKKPLQPSDTVNIEELI